MDIVIRFASWVKWRILHPLLRRFPRAWSVVEPLRYRRQFRPPDLTRNVPLMYYPGDLVRITAEIREALGPQQAGRWLTHLEQRCREFEQLLRLVSDAVENDQLDTLREQIISPKKEADAVHRRRVTDLERLREAQRSRHNGCLSHALGLVESIEQLPANLEYLPERIREILRILEQGPELLGMPATERIEPGDGPVLLALHNSLPYDRAGYALRTHMLLKSLRRVDQSAKPCTRPGYPWDLQAHRLQERSPTSECGDITYTRLDSGSFPYNLVPDSEYIKQYARQLATQIQEGRPRAIHGVSNYLNGLAAIMAARELGLPAIYELRGLWHYSRAARRPEFRETELYAYQDLMERFAAREADYLITISEALKRHLVTDWGICEDKITVVPNAVDVELFRPIDPDRELREQLGMKHRFALGFIGSLTTYEGLDDLLRAVASFGDDGVGLVVVGDGRCRQDLEALAQELQCGDRVRFTGRVPFEEVQRFYSCFDACVYPRKNLDVCRYVPPLKPLEAMAMGVPVIVSDVPPLLELVDGGRLASVSTAGDSESLVQAIDRLRGSAEFRQALGEAGRSWVGQNRSWTAAALKTREVYTSSLSLVRDAPTP